MNDFLTLLNGHSSFVLAHTGSRSTTAMRSTEIISTFPPQFGHHGSHDCLHFDNLAHLRFVKPDEDELLENETWPSAKLIANLPGKIFFGVIFQKDFGFANHPALHFETEEEQATVLR